MQTYRKLRKKNCCRKSGFRVFLSLRYGTDLGRSQLVGSSSCDFFILRRISCLVVVVFGVVVSRYVAHTFVSRIIRMTWCWKFFLFAEGILVVLQMVVVVGCHTLLFWERLCCHLICLLVFVLGSSKILSEVPVFCCSLFVVADTPECGYPGDPVSAVFCGVAHISTHLVYQFGIEFWAVVFPLSFSAFCPFMSMDRALPSMPSHFFLV